MATTVIAGPLNIAGIFRESIKTPTRNGKLMFQVLFLNLCMISPLLLLHHHLAFPLMVKVEDGYESSSLDQKDVSALLGMEVLFVAAFSVVSLFRIMVTIYASALTYTGVYTRLTDLMSRIKSSWRKSFITWLYVCFLTIIYIILFSFVMKLIQLTLSTNASYFWCAILTILATLFYCYPAAIWALGLVISVMEEDVNGAKGAIERARKLLRSRKFEGILIVLILMVLNFPIYISFYVASADDDDKLGSITQLGFGFVATVLLCASEIFSFVVFTVFYYECKQSYGEKLMELEKPGYSLVSPQIQVDPSLF